MINMRKSAKSRNMHKYFTTSGILRHDQRPVKCQLFTANWQLFSVFSVQLRHSGNISCLSQVLYYTVKSQTRLMQFLSSQVQVLIQAQGRSHWAGQVNGPTTAHRRSHCRRHRLSAAPVAPTHNHYFISHKKQTAIFRPKTQLGSCLSALPFDFFRGAFSSINSALQFLCFAWGISVLRAVLAVI